MRPAPLRVRRLKPHDVENHQDPSTFGDVLQILIGHGDTEFVASLFDSAKYRLAWILEREADARAQRKRG